MNGFTKREMEEAIQAIASMISRSEKAQEKFAQGTSQYTLQKNRVKALYIALSLIAKELAQENADRYTKEDMKKAIAPISSLTSKSEKAIGKLTQGTWQHTMLRNNLKALYIASSLLSIALSDLRPEKNR